MNLTANTFPLTRNMKNIQKDYTNITYKLMVHKSWLTAADWCLIQQPKQPLQNLVFTSMLIGWNKSIKMAH